MSKPHAVGIDLGTTYSAVAYLDERGRTSMVRNAEGEILTPSVVLFDDTEIVVGREAKKLSSLRVGSVAECVKRDMGRPSYSRLINGERLPPEVIQACILKKLNIDTQTALPGDLKVVITVPAYFDEPRRKATADAGEMAGLQVLDIVNEPTAAALAFGETLGYLSESGTAREPLKVLVYDLGGGTFDVTVIDLRPGDVRTLATDGDVQLGGHDWDMRLVDHVCEQFRREHNADPRLDPVCMARLTVAVEDAKHTLSARAKAVIPVEHAGHRSEVTVTRQTFEELTADLLERTAYTTRQVLAASHLTWSEINRVLLVGGSTRMPMVTGMLHGLSGITPDHSVYPDEAVARGAALFAGYLMAKRDDRGAPPQFRVTDVNSHSLGIEGIDTRTMRKENTIVIPRNTPLPAKVMEKFVTKKDSQRSVIVQVLEGESPAPEQCSPIGRAVLRKLPPGLPKGWPVEVCYEYLTNGRLDVRAQVPGTDRDLLIELEREGSLSAAAIGRWRQVMVSGSGFDAFKSAIADVLGLDGGEAADDDDDKPRRRDAAEHTSKQASSPSVAHELKQRPALAQAVPVAVSQPAMVPAPVVGSEPLPDRVASGQERPRPSFSAADASRVRTSARKRMMAANLLGHVVASTLGIALGYYILVWQWPEANFLNLDLPGLPSPGAKPGDG